MNDLTLSEGCRIERRCGRCKRLVVRRALGGFSDEMEEYLCVACGGADSRKASAARWLNKVLILIAIGIAFALLLKVYDSRVNQCRSEIRGECEGPVMLRDAQ